MTRRHQGELLEIRKRMQQILADIGQSYDFHKFSFESLVSWIENRRSRKIVFVPWLMDTSVFGAWIASEDYDYIFYAANALPVHQLHIKLHELSHILCGHQTVTVTTDAVYHLWMQSLQNEAPSTSFLMRSLHKEEKEREAEILSSLIQEQAFRNDRWQVLTNALTVNRDLERFYQAIGLVR